MEEEIESEDMIDSCLDVDLSHYLRSHSYMGFDRESAALNSPKDSIWYNSSFFNQND